ncbi:DUF1643 domain-containing protein [Paenibacillus marinisediminis]
MSTDYKLLEGFIKIPSDMTDTQFYLDLKRWIEGCGGKYIRDSIDLLPNLVMQRSQHLAVFNEDKTNRYTLRIDWDIQKAKVTILMMNPSHATELYSDETVRFMIQYAIRYFNAGSVWIVNMSSFIEPDSQKLASSKFTGDKNDQSTIVEAINWSDVVFLAWGDKGEDSVVAFGSWFEELLKKNTTKLKCFRQSKAGNPIHRNQRPKIQLDHVPQNVDLNKIFLKKRRAKRK